MSFSYSNDPGTSSIDEVRFLLGDIAAPGLLSDEEINYYITKVANTFSDVTMAAAFCADAIAARYAGEVSISADGVTYSGDQLQQKYTTLAVSLRSTYNQLQQQGAEAFAGGTDVTDIPQGVVPLNFGVGMLDNARAGNQRYGYYGDLLLVDDNYEPDDGSGPF
jgi:hypothetical protein